MAKRDTGRPLAEHGGSTKTSGVDCGDTRKIGKTAPVVEEIVAETLDCELICPSCGCDTMLWFGHTPPRPRQTNEGER